MSSRFGPALARDQCAFTERASVRLLSSARYRLINMPFFSSAFSVGYAASHADMRASPAYSAKSSRASFDRVQCLCASCAWRNRYAAEIGQRLHR